MEFGKCFDVGLFLDFKKTLFLLLMKLNIRAI